MEQNILHHCPVYTALWDANITVLGDGAKHPTPLPYLHRSLGCQHNGTDRQSETSCTTVLFTLLFGMPLIATATGWRCSSRQTQTRTGQELITASGGARAPIRAQREGLQCLKLHYGVGTFDLCMYIDFRSLR